MEFYVMAKSYDCYGAHTTLSPIGNFLLRNSNNFGDAIREISVTFNFASSGPPKKTLESLYQEHHEHRLKLPGIVFRRTKGRVEINIASDLLDGIHSERSSRLSLPLFRAAVDEVIESLSLLKKRIKSTDDFDLNAFLAHCSAAKQLIPQSEDDLQDLPAQLKLEALSRRSVMSPWDQLGIDWEDFHPKARDILDAPFFWSCTDDFSPNGNDTGADLLTDYGLWLKKNENRSPIHFLKSLSRRWGYASFEEMDSDVKNESAVGLAFAELKLRATCNEHVCKLALDAIAQQRSQAQAATEWTYRDERLRALDKLQSKLQAIASPPAQEKPGILKRFLTFLTNGKA